MKRLPVFFLMLSLLLSRCSTKEDVMTIEGILYSSGQPVSIAVAGGKIIGVKKFSRSQGKPLDYIAPGLVDIQINGYMGVDFSDPGLKPDDMRKVTEALWAEGVTTYLPTLTTAGHESLVNSFRNLSAAMEDPDISRSIPGYHLEGPYISPVAGYRGAHLEKYVRNPDFREFTEYQNAANHRILVVAVAPETDGAIPFIRECVENGVVVTLAHHNGNAGEITRAVDAGASMSNHLGNGCANLINRHNNPLWPQLAEDRLSVSIIADGFHLTPEEVQCFYRIKGDGRTMLVSDAVDLAGLPPGEYIREERKLLLTEGVVKYPAENVLAGAAHPLRKCVENMMTFTHCSLGSAIHMASRNPAGILGLEDIGEIQEGRRANLILFTMQGKEIKINKTFVDGVPVYQSE
jgi:N-acetylglucosamine-6-phosphate deacetylase